MPAEKTDGGEDDVESRSDDQCTRLEGKQARLISGSVCIVLVNVISQLKRVFTVDVAL